MRASGKKILRRDCKQYDAMHLFYLRVPDEKAFDKCESELRPKAFDWNPYLDLSDFQDSQCSE